MHQAWICLSLPSRVCCSPSMPRGRELTRGCRTVLVAGQVVEGAGQDSGAPDVAELVRENALLRRRLRRAETKLREGATEQQQQQMQDDVGEGTSATLDAETMDETDPALVDSENRTLGSFMPAAYAKPDDPEVRAEHLTCERRH